MSAFPGAVPAPSHPHGCRRWVCVGTALALSDVPSHVVHAQQPRSRPQTPSPAPHPFSAHGQPLVSPDGATDGPSPLSIPFPGAFCYEFLSLLEMNPSEQESSP